MSARNGVRVCFPECRLEYGRTAHRYYATHFRFVLGVLRYGGWEIEWFKPELSHTSERSQFVLRFGDHDVLFDISDYEDTLDDGVAGGHDAVFKFHYSRRLHWEWPNVFPFSPISFYDWEQYHFLEKEITYPAVGRILNNQRAHTQNRERRQYVRELLQSRFGPPEIDLERTDQVAFWRKINGAALSVCVPGARLDILDRGQLQYMAFGVCTLSPRLSGDLPRGEWLVPGGHYLECKADWSDLVDQIEWACAHPQACREIGANAKALFQRCLTAAALLKWMLQCVDTVTSSRPPKKPDEDVWRM